MTDSADYARCWCGMTAAEHTPYQSRCPQTPEAVEKFAAIVATGVIPSDKGSDD